MATKMDPKVLLQILEQIVGSMGVVPFRIALEGVPPDVTFRHLKYLEERGDISGVHADHLRDSTFSVDSLSVSGIDLLQQLRRDAGTS